MENPADNLLDPLTPAGMTAEIILRNLLIFLAGFGAGAAALYSLMRGMLAGVGRAMPFRDDRTREYSAPTAARMTYGR